MSNASLTFADCTSAAGIADGFRKNAATLQAELDALTPDERCDYIVQVEGVCINFDGQPGVLGGMVSTLRDATTFQSYGLALKAARTVINGAGKRGEVILLQFAYFRAIEKCTKFANDFDAMSFH